MKESEGEPKSKPVQELPDTFFYHIVRLKMLGMMLTDTIDSILVFRMINQSYWL